MAKMAHNPISSPSIMKSQTHFPEKSQQGSIIVYVLVAMVLLGTIGSIGTHVTQQTKVTSRQTQLAKAYQFADGGASIATYDLNRAFTSNANDIATGLTEDEEFPYALSNSLSTVDEFCYVRTIGAPFTNQIVSAQIWLKKDSSEGTARVVAVATSGEVAQTVTVHIMASYAFGAALISTAEGDGSTEVSKKSAQKGQLVIEGEKITIEGGATSNGSTIYDKFVPKDGQIDADLYGTDDEIPNYTDPSSTNQLFDFERFSAVGDAMGTRYTVKQFQQAMKEAYETGPGYLEGIIVIDIDIDDGSITNYADL
tara:strand:- start:641 stop:1573 length:933 start_codon:yes stop_codon:yes gene_type:complete